MRTDIEHRDFSTQDLRFAFVVEEACWGMNMSRAAMAKALGFTPTALYTALKKEGACLSNDNLDKLLEVTKIRHEWFKKGEGEIYKSTNTITRTFETSIDKEELRNILEKAIAEGRITGFIRQKPIPVIPIDIAHEYQNNPANFVDYSLRVVGRRISEGAFMIKMKDEHAYNEKENVRYGTGVILTIDPDPSIRLLRRKTALVNVPGKGNHIYFVRENGETTFEVINKGFKKHLEIKDDQMDGCKILGYVIDACVPLSHEEL